MPTIGATTKLDVLETFATAGRMAKRAASLRAAAQSTTDVLFEAFEETLVLVRVFAVVRHAELPVQDRAFAEALASVHGLPADIGPDTPVLSLLGTRGRRPAWNARALSSGHLAIPLSSDAFVAAAPMLARMFHELGHDVATGSAGDRSIVAKLLSAGLGGVFHVPDAATATDAGGRKIIAAQDFVREEGVKTVFGVAGRYPGGRSLAALFFTTELLSEDDAKLFLPLVHELKAATTELVEQDRLYG